ncbi:hypothetical protein F5144DRAFT_593711 [Chaetomium tenue]|uniref:Uncharacterized protein n=1 Tax=Chaetomium tenue TaxID=1854479 RepID=A0ACB7P0J3_9PEZI|nr:hypothetical protein F5144DRAFT_593711 [Chaetomium globosum]
MGVTRKRIPNTTSFPTRIRRQCRTCVQCAKAKRKCDQTEPACSRCRGKGVDCNYPPQRNDLIPLGEHESMLEMVDILPERGENCAFSAVTPVSRTLSPSHPTEITVSHPGTDTVNYGWFLTPESWTRQYGLSEPQPDLTASQRSLPHFINKLKAWMAAWVADGHCPILHQQLYQDGMPECVEDAYTALAAYNLASPSGKPTALQIVQNRLDKLLSQYPQPDPSTLDGISPACLLDTPTHLARTQALFTYQLITLFDGDIRARVEAERHATTLILWCRQLLESAQLDCAAATMLSPTTPNPTTLPPNTDETLSLTPPLPSRPNPITTTIPPSTSTPPSPLTLPPAPPPSLLPPSSLLPDPSTLFQTWIPSESARRIYLAATCMLAVYDTLRNGWASCPGGVAFTAQRGLWEARSGGEWMGVLTEMRMRGEGGGGGDGGGRPGEVDEFAVGLLEITCGVEHVESWCFERGGG